MILGIVKVQVHQKQMDSIDLKEPRCLKCMTATQSKRRQY